MNRAFRAGLIIAQLLCISPALAQREEAPAVSHAVNHCDEGVAEDCLALANDNNTAGTAAEATRYYQKACQLGNQSGCTYAAWRTLIPTQKFDEALQIFDGACAKGSHPGCCNKAAVLVLRGRLDEAQSVYQDECDKTVPLGCAGVAMILRLKGQAEQGRKFLEQACRQNPHNCFGFAVYLRHTGHNAEARKYLTMLCKGGTEYACQNLGYLELDAGHLAAAGTAFEQACAKELPFSCAEKAVIDLPPEQKNMLSRFYREQCDVGNSVACYRLAVLAGAQSRPGEMLKLMKTACARGYFYACPAKAG